MFNGFLMPYSGYVKRFVLKDYGLKVFNDFDERFIIVVENYHFLHLF